MFTFLPASQCFVMDRPGLAITCCNFQVSQINKQTFQRFGVEVPFDYPNMVQKRKYEYLAGRVCAHKALSVLGGASVQVVRNAAGLPIWPELYTGSISHCKMYAIACVGCVKQYKSVGVDVEGICTTDVAEELSVQIMRGSECVQCASMFSMEVYTSLIFSAKEAVFKALFPEVGYIFEFNDILLVNINNTVATFELQKTLSFQWSEGAQIDAQYKVLSDRVYTCVLNLVS